MSAVRKWVAAIVCWLVITGPFAFAESSEYIASYRTQTGILSAGAQQLRQPDFLDSCAQPGQAVLDAILPVATDHGSHASGIVIDENRVLTAAHAVQGAGHFFVRVGSRFRSADLIIIDHRHDLAVLAVDTDLIEPLRISAIRPAHSDSVWAAGYPRAQSMSLSVGSLQESSEGALHTSATIDSGQSGGGLLACSAGDWSLVGMLRGYGAYLQGDHYVKLENHSVSVASSTINEFLLNFH